MKSGVDLIFQIGNVTFMTNVDKPKNLQTSQTSPTGTTITWESPDAPIEGYVFKYRYEKSSSDWLLRSGSYFYQLVHLGLLPKDCTRF